MEFPKCIGSGYCCWKVICPLGATVHGSGAGPCPSLVWDEDAQRHWCGLVLNAKTEAQREKVKNYLSIDAGCCSSGNSWRREELRDRTKEPDAT